MYLLLRILFMKLAILGGVSYGSLFYSNVVLSARFMSSSKSDHCCIVAASNVMRVGLLLFIQHLHQTFMAQILWNRNFLPPPQTTKNPISRQRQRFTAVLPCDSHLATSVGLPVLIAADLKPALFCGSLAFDF